MPDSPMFSVVTPTYNRKCGVCSAVESLMLQTFGDFELMAMAGCARRETPR